MLMDTPMKNLKKVLRMYMNLKPEEVDIDAEAAIMTMLKLE